jgi:NAD+ synthase
MSGKGEAGAGGMVGALTPAVLALDWSAEADFIAQRFRELVVALRRRGAVVAVSGGIDSSVCLALAVRALGPERVVALSLPERESSGKSRSLATLLTQHLGVELLTHDLTPALEGMGAYAARDAAIREVFPDYGPGWKNKIVIAGGTAGGLNFWKLIVQDPGGHTFEKRLPPKPYLQIVAAQNHKQRLRKTMDYYHADRLNYVVVGTPNRLEYDQGFFVKNGDGAADVKPIAHLYKTQVYALARHLALPDEICGVTPTTDTYSLPQGQDEFYFALPYAQMDVALWALNHGLPAATLATSLGISEERAALVYKDIRQKRITTAPLHSKPLLIRPVDELPAVETK